MIKEEKFPAELVDGVEVLKTPITGIDEIQYLYIAPKTSIKLHGHNNQWEVWTIVSKKESYICPKDEKHELINNSNEPVKVMAIKGNLDYSYEELSNFFTNLGFTTYHGSIKIEE